MAINPILTELSQLSPGAQQALVQAHGAMGVPGPSAAQQRSVIPKPQDAGPAPSLMTGPGMASSAPPLSLQAPSPPNVVQAPPPMGSMQDLQQKRNLMAAQGSGISQIHSKIENSDFGQAHPFLGKLVGWGAEIPTRIAEAGGAMLGPTAIAERLLPGTEYHHMGELRNLNNIIAKQGEEGATAANTANLGATTAHTQAQTAGLPQEQADAHDVSQIQQGNIQSEQNDRDALAANPPLATAYAHAVNQAIKEGRDPSQDPIVQHISDAITSLQPGQNKQTEGKSVNVINPATGKPMVATFHPDTGKTTDSTGKEIFNPQPYEKPQSINVNAGTAALDRETKQFGSSHQKTVDAANAQLEKIEDARNMINGNAESQALGVPKVLTALVGGQGTGVRITTPELNAIAKARGLSGDVEGTLNKWAGQGALTKTQQQQLTSILNDVQQRILQKQAIASEALDQINGASTREQIIQADKAARQKLMEMEKGGGTINTSPNGKNNDPLGVR